MSVSQSSVVRGPNPNAPPIPRRGDFGRGSSGGTIVPDNIARAREQVRIAQNRRRTPVARRTGSNLVSRELIELSQSAEDKFRAGVLRDAGDRARVEVMRDQERNRISRFQNRSGRVSSVALQRERARIAEERSMSSLAQFAEDIGEPPRDYSSLESSFLRRQSSRGGTLPRQASAPIGTRINQPQPEPEPEPERIPDAGGFTFATPFSVGGGSNPLQRSTTQ